MHCIFNCLVTRPLIKFFSFRYRFEALIKWKLILSNIRSLGTEKLKLFQGANDFQDLRYETLVIAIYYSVNSFSFAVLGVILWPEEDDDLYTNHILVCEISSIFECGSPPNFRTQGSLSILNSRKIFELDLLS